MTRVHGQTFPPIRYQISQGVFVQELAVFKTRYGETVFTEGGFREGGFPPDAVAGYIMLKSATDRRRILIKVAVIRIEIAGTTIEELVNEQASPA